MMKVEISEQVEAYIRSLPPEPRRKLRLAVRKLASLSGDSKQLEGTLSKF
jgi:mRNA-degrading endonuclease RelE of RelBE toxin-antitoxin system